MNLRFLERGMVASLAILFAFTCGSPTLQSPPPGPVAVMVVGSLHLRQLNPDSTPVAVDMIARRVERFNPDHVVIEWLHPSIAPEGTFNYRTLGDFATLSRLWGYELSRIESLRDSLRQVVLRLRADSTPRGVVAVARLELGKLFYLNRDVANAAYQWYQAGRDGAGIADVSRLVRGILDGHEAAAFGFSAGVRHGVEFITGFDYQGPDAGSEVWGEMLEQMRETVVTRTAAGNRTAALAQFDTLRRHFETSSDSSWLRRYGSAPEVMQYVKVLDGFRWASDQLPRARDGLAQMRYLQSPEYEAVERRVQVELIGGIEFGGFGRRRLAGIMNRNRHMVEFAEADIRREGSRRVLIVVGAAHKFALEDLFQERGYQVIPSSGFMP